MLLQPADAPKEPSKWTNTHVPSMRSRPSIDSDTNERDLFVTVARHQRRERQHPPVRDRAAAARPATVAADATPRSQRRWQPARRKRWLRRVTPLLRSFLVL